MGLSVSDAVRVFECIIPLVSCVFKRAETRLPLEGKKIHFVASLSLSRKN